MSTFLIVNLDFLDEKKIKKKFFNFDINNLNNSLIFKLNKFLNKKKFIEDFFGIFLTIPTSTTSFFVFFKKV